ncbi:hypothetical protein KQI63_16180 [bacterium]|nr:hypothetical protein [bacterium]
MHSTKKWIAVLLLLGSCTFPLHAKEIDLGTLVEGVVQELVPEKEQPWRVTMQPNGRAWMWQFSGRDRLVHWDFGASVWMEIARGRGHRTWFGVSYREAAGFGENQSITPFDPRHVDTAQHLGWRYGFTDRFRVFTWVSRWCYHEIDVYNRHAVFFTHAGTGLGTIAPPEEGEPARLVYKTQKPRFDAYLMAGPMISGGPIDILGITTTYQAEVKLYAAWIYPLNRTFQLEPALRWDALILHENASLRERQRIDIRLNLNIQRAGGGFSFFGGRHLEDRYIDRRSPIDWYLGVEHRF